MTKCRRLSTWRLPTKCATERCPVRRAAWPFSIAVGSNKRRNASGSIGTERCSDDVGRDVRYAFRIFAKHPGFTFVVVLTLALGIGANTAIFSLIDALMLRWLPVRNPQELVQPNSGPQMRVGLPPRASRIRLSARSQNRPT